MARTFWDGADAYSTIEQVSVKWQVYSNITLVDGRFGGRAIRVGNNASGQGRLSRSIPATDRHSLGVALRLNGPNRPVHMGAGFYSSPDWTNGATPTNRQVGWTVDTEGRIIVWRGSSTILWQSDPGVVVDSAYIFIGFSAIIHPSAGSFSLSANGFLIQEQTGINTRGLGDDNFTNVNFGMGSQSTASAMHVDDIYFDDEYLSLVPERRIETLRPTSDGANLNLIPSTGVDHFAMVDETLVDAADYLSGSLPGEYDEFPVSPLGNVPTVIDGVQGSGFALKTDAATRAVNYGIRSNATDANGPDIPLGTTMQQGFNNVLLDPDGGVAWDAAAVNAIHLLARIAV